MTNYFKLSILLLSSLLIISCSSSDNDDDVIITKEENEITANAIIAISTELGENSLKFDKKVANSSDSKIFTVSNTGDANLVITSITAPIGYSLDLNSVTITPNSSKDITVYFEPTEVSNYEGQIVFESNALSGKNTINCSGTGVNEVFEGAILTTQQEVNDFGNIGYTEATEGIIIGSENGFSETDIVDLTPLVTLTKVANLRIRRNPLLLNLDGLENVNVTGVLSILQNDGLLNIDALSTITTLSSTLQIGYNKLLKNIDGLSNITTAAVVFINGNDVLENIDGLMSLSSIETDLNVSENFFITNLNGLANLTTVSGNVSIEDNDRLDNYCGIKPLLINDGIGGIFYARSFNKYNPGTSEIKNGECQKDIPLGVYHGYLSITLQGVMDKFNEKGFEQIDGGLYIDGRENLLIESLKLENLRRINGNLTIRRTTATNLDQLENLIYVDGSIDIRENASLSEFCGLLPLINDAAGLTGTFTSSDNEYNPTQQELEEGTCTQ
ncbi:hypothetical protein [Maribacter sp. Asnod2-G09]|uniref:Ig-like domain-containing protein n=1 Tax=Maribacter sp. Asnod2-G09 TaxID=3160577 RepID=UPI003867265F